MAQNGMSYVRVGGEEPLREMTVGAALDLAAATWGPRTALVEFGPDTAGRRWTFEQLRTDAQQVTRALLHRFRPGAHIGVWAANRPEWVLLELGAAYAGVTLVTVNPAYQIGELHHVLGQSRCQGVIVQAPTADGTSSRSSRKPAPTSPRSARPSPCPSGNSSSPPHQGPTNFRRSPLATSPKSNTPPAPPAPRKVHNSPTAA